MKKIDKNGNFLELVPEKRCKWEKSVEGKVRLLVPRFKNRWMRAFALKMGRSEFFTVSLDEIGSRVWEAIDGTLTVGQIGEIMEKEGEAAKDGPMVQVYERLTQYMSMLLRHRFIEFKDKKGGAYG
jgi:hypothetical protein